MRKDWKGFASFIVAASIALTTASVVQAYGLNTRNVETTSIADQRITNVEQFMGKRFVLLDTYKNPDIVRAKYERAYATYIKALCKEFSLPRLTADTASDYKHVLLASNIQTNNNLFALVQFLDIYENERENAEIRQQFSDISRKVNNHKLSREEAIEQARLLVPTRSENGNDKPIFQTRNSGINLSAARNYARKYAVKPNPKYGVEKSWFIRDVDCTNFASQILFAGGVGMDTYNDIHKGWWWKGKGNRSVSWINANTFKNYMGSGYSTKSWHSLVSNVRAGDFIGVDFGNDGSVDHIGFVYAKSGGKLQIAQHTRNYLDWNGNWPESNNHGRYYRVRR